MNTLNLDKNKTYLIALSGGPDSMALCYMAIKGGFNIVVAHVNYHHRQEADREEQMVREFCASHDAKCFVKEAYFNNEGNFENWARIIRYEFFKEVIKEIKADACLVGHHQDDLIETYLMQLKRGYVSNYGLAKETIIKDVKIIRPLLEYTKDDLANYCKENNVPYAIDKTNFDTSLTRNKIRHEVIDNLSIEERNNILQSIKNENDKIEQIMPVISEFVNDKVLISKLKTYDKEIVDRALFTIANKTIDECYLGRKRLDEIEQIIFNQEGNKMIHLKDNYYFLKEYDCLKIVKKEMYNYCIVVDKPMIVENEYIYFDLITNPHKFYINETSYPLRIEIVKKGDVVKIGKIHKSINRLLIDQKIPYTKRLYWPKIVNNKGRIIFVPKNEEDDEGLFLVKGR